jgi:type IV pilus assembly protein PilW
MKRGLKQGLPDRQHGFSLLELLIATSIGMVITVGAIAVFSNSTGASKTTEAQSRMNEDAQAALSLLSKEIKMAGYISSASKPLTLAIQGCSGMLKVNANSASDDELSCEIGVTDAPHSLFISYEADEWNTVLSRVKKRPTDCLGFELSLPLPQSPASAPSPQSPASAPSIPPYLAKNRYYIDTSQVIRPRSLYCKGNGGLGFPQPMIENIEDLKFSFGTAAMPAPAASAASAPQPIAGYLSATEVEKLAPSQSKNDIASAWNQVRTVQICIVVRSEDKNLVSDNASSTYTKCDGTQDASQTDRRLRRAYTTTVYLRNHK